MRAEDHAVESILRVLRQQGLVIAARTVTDVLVEDKIRTLVWHIN